MSSRARTRSRPPSARALAAAAVLLVTACGEGPASDGGPDAAAASHRPNVLLISIDALRADHLGAYGYERDTSPFLDELAEQGLRFSQAFVNTHGTPPSHATILTSLYQETHRVGMRPGPSQPRNDAIPPGLPLLPERLREAGYRTVAVTGGGYMSRTFGFDRGFDHFARSRGIDVARRKLVEAIRESEPGRPIFALLHTYEIHTPYQPPAPYRTLFGEFTSEVTGRSDELVPIQHHALSRLQPEDVEYLEAMYDGEIRYTDDVLRQLFDELREIGFLDGALVVVTSDHGEEFGDHGGLLHRASLYDELLHVPLLLWGQGVTPGVDDRLVSSIDVAPTLLAAAGLASTAMMAGEDLLATPRGPGRSVFAQYDTDLYAIVTDRWKLIEHRGSGRIELYDRIADPGERRDRAEDEPEVAERLRERLHEWRRDLPGLGDLPRPVVEVPPEESERLRALGYVD